MTLFPKCLLVLIILFSFNTIVLGKKTDKVFMQNGDELTCNIKHLKYGILKVSVDDMSSIKIEWDAIDSIWSDREFEIRFADGSLEEWTLEDEFYERINGDLNLVIELSEIEDSFIDRLDGNLDLGFNFDKSSDIIRIYVEGDLTHKRFKKETSLHISNISTLDGSDERTRNRDIRIINQWLANNDVSYRGILGFDQNSELGLQGRILGGGGIGKDFLNEQSEWLFGGLGMVGNVEWSTEVGKTSATNAEVVALLEFKKFSYDFPELDFESKLSAYPGISNWGRVRFTWDTNLRWEVFDDFYTGVNFYFQFDNEPIDVEASKSDWGTNFSIGYKF